MTTWAAQPRTEDEYREAWEMEIRHPKIVCSGGRPDRLWQAVNFEMGRMGEATANDILNRLKRHDLKPDYNGLTTSLRRWHADGRIAIARRVDGLAVWRLP